MDLTSKKAALAFQIVQKITDAGHQALFAGGCVRDYLLGTIPTDFDIATSATPDQIEKIFAKTVPVGKQFGVMLVILESIQFEVATFRTEGGYQDGRHPTIINFSNAEEDASRRDFTVNGLFYDPVQKQVLDYVNGQQDIQYKTIRCIGAAAQRFDEDKLRLLRAIRFAAKLGFQIEEQTWDEIKKRSEQIAIVSRERIRDELDKIWMSSHMNAGVNLLIQSGLLKVLLPQISPLAIARLSKLNMKSIPLVYAALFSEYKKNEIEAFLRDLRCSNETIQNTLLILNTAHQFQNFQNLREGELKRLLSSPHFPESLQLFTINPVNGGAQLAAFKSKIEALYIAQLPAPFLNGQDLTGLGLIPGPKIGQILEEAYLQQLETKIKDRNEALEWARSQINQGN